MDKKFLDLNEQYLMQVDGGSFLVGCAVVGCIAFFGWEYIMYIKILRIKKINLYRMEATFL